MELNYNIFNLIIISGVLYGVIFSLLVLFKRQYITNNTIYLALVVLFLSLSNFQYWLLDVGFIQKHHILKLIYIPWHWLVLPMFYIYVFKFLKQKPISTKMLFLILSPFFVVLTIHCIQLFYKFFIDSNYDIPSHFKRGVFVYLEFFSVIFNFWVMYKTYHLIVHYEKDTTYDITWVKSETNWLKKLIYTGVVVCLFWLVAIIVVVIYNLDQSYIFYPMWLGISFLVYWIGHVGLNKSLELRNRIQLRRKRIKNKHKISEETFLTQNAFLKIEQAINSGKLYLNPNLTLSELSKTLNLSEGYVSQLINKNTESNFNDYINMLRIKEAKLMLKEIDYDNYTITAIGLEAGFNSKSSFYNAFKKFTNTTPVLYKKNVRNL